MHLITHSLVALALFPFLISNIDAQFLSFANDEDPQIVYRLRNLGVADPTQIATTLNPNPIVMDKGIPEFFPKAPGGRHLTFVPGRKDLDFSTTSLKGAATELLNHYAKDTVDQMAHVAQDIWNDASKKKRSLCVNGVKLVTASFTTVCALAKQDKNTAGSSFFFEFKTPVANAENIGIIYFVPPDPSASTDFLTDLIACFVNMLTLIDFADLKIHTFRLDFPVAPDLIPSGVSQQDIMLATFQAIGEYRKKDALPFQLALIPNSLVFSTAFDSVFPATATSTKNPNGPPQSPVPSPNPVPQNSPSQSSAGRVRMVSSFATAIYAVGFLIAFVR